MSAATKHSDRIRWSLSRVMIVILAGAFAGLLVDIRVEHVDAVRQRSIAWLPIIYGGLMMPACLLGALFWNGISRVVLRLLFSVAIGIGALGFYLHNRGEVGAVVRTSVRAWSDAGMSHSDDPPMNAPLAFAGLGMMGMVVLARRYD